MTDRIDYGPRYGADPEFFIQDTKGKVLPAFGLIGGTKDSPIILDNGTLRKNQKDIGNFAYQEDGAAMEFNIPASNVQGFIANIQNMYNWCCHFLADKGLQPKFKASHRFQEDVLRRPEAQIIGCVEDNDAWSKGIKRNPFNAGDFGAERFCGGHIHVQYNYENVPRAIFAQFMDLFVGLPSIKFDKQGSRRKFYGLPGIYREKDYGIEYRTLSNFWVDPTHWQVMEYLLCSLKQLADYANGNPNKLEEVYGKVPWSAVQTAISEEDERQANDILSFMSSYLDMSYAATVNRIRVGE